VRLFAVKDGLKPDADCEESLAMLWVRQAAWFTDNGRAKRTAAGPGAADGTQAAKP